MIKKILCALIIVLTLLALVSCEGLFGTTPQDPDENKPGGNTNNNVPENVTYNKIVYTDESLRESTSDSDIFSLDDVRLAMLDVTYPVTLGVAGAEALSGEIVFGDSDRAITAKAKEALDAEIARSTKNDTGYIIYVEAPYVAVYWMDPGMAQIALTTFVRECVEDGQLIFEDGIAYSELYVAREFEKEKYWLALEAAEVDENIIRSLRGVFNYFDGRMLAGWCANLYDPEIGGFYYSRSARDTAGYLPDIESTSQLLGTLISNKAFINYGNDRNRAIPEEIRRKIVAFAQSLQCEDDGYFYHPQWPQGRENLNTDRYGRDLGNATSVITSFKFDTDGDGIEETQRPLWCAPNGSKCALHFGTDDKCTFIKTVSYYTENVEGKVTVSLTSSVRDAVASVAASNVAPTAAVSKYPDYSSRAAFSAWLEAYNANIKENSGNAHNLAAIASEIAQHGYMDIVLDHLDRVQAELFREHQEEGIEPTGLWQTDINYRLVWGMLKYGTFYNNKEYGRAIDPKYIPYIIKSCAKVTALPPDGKYYMNDLYNQWTSISNLITNVERYNKEYLPDIYAAVRENASTLIDNTLKKIEPMAMEDGSIAYHSTGISMTSIYGTPIAMGMREGDVNAMALCTGMYRAMYTCMGYGAYEVPIFSPEDGEYFLSELENCQPINKGEIEAEVYTFDEDTIPTTITFKGLSGGGSVEIVDDPEDSDNGVLYFVGGTNEQNGDYLNFAPAANGASCYIAEFRIFISSESDDGYLFQNSLGNKYIFTFTKNGRTVTIKDIPSTSHNNGQQTITTFSVDEWHTIRVEFYIASEENGNVNAPRTKYWLDGELVEFNNLSGEKVTYSENYIGADTGGSAGSSYNTFAFYAMKKPHTYIYLDDCFFSSDNKAFDAEDATISDFRQ